MKIEADDDSGTVHIRGRDNAPLSMSEGHAELTITGEDMRVDITIDAKQLDALADSIFHVQESYK